MSLEGKVAIVTGASRGIGKAIATALAEAGASVIGTATTDGGAANISDYLGAIATNGKVMGLKLDVTDKESIKAAMAVVKEHFDAPTILVNNAGITKDNLMLRMKDDEWDDVISTNLSSIFRLSKACIKGMTKARWGRIINISSVVGSMGNAGQSNYAAAKAGLEGYTRSLAREFGSRNITVNALAPGFIDTDMTKELPEAQKEMLKAQIPLARLGQPEEIAAVVAFLASEAAGYITGTTIHVNGGMYM